MLLPAKARMLPWYSPTSIWSSETPDTCSLVAMPDSVSPGARCTDCPRPSGRNRPKDPRQKAWAQALRHDGRRPWRRRPAAEAAARTTRLHAMQRLRQPSQGLGRLGARSTCRRRRSGDRRRCGRGRHLGGRRRIEQQRVFAQAAARPRQLENHVDERLLTGRSLVMRRKGVPSARRCSVTEVDGSTGL